MMNTEGTIVWPAGQYQSHCNVLSCEEDGEEVWSGGGLTGDWRDVCYVRPNIASHWRRSHHPAPSSQYNKPEIGTTFWVTNQLSPANIA